MPVNRRELLQTALGGTMATALVGVHRACLANADLDGEIRHPFLTDGQRATIAAVAERIIPETETPGAAEAGVPAFIELMLSDWYTEIERAPVLAGIAQLDLSCAERWGANFAGSSIERQAEALEAVADRPFFELLRQLTVYGYYTSEVGAKAELSFLPAPGRYTTIDFADVGKQWVR